MTKANVRNVNDSETEILSDVDLIASGYEATCPRCEELCELIEVPPAGHVVECPGCGATFATDLPEHAYG